MQLLLLNEGFEVNKTMSTNTLVVMNKRGVSINNQPMRDGWEEIKNRMKRTVGLESFHVKKKVGWVMT